MELLRRRDDPGGSEEAGPQLVISSCVERPSKRLELGFRQDAESCGDESGEERP